MTKFFARASVLGLAVLLSACGKVTGGGGGAYSKAGGDTDDTFSVGTGFSGAVDKILVQSDGRIVVGGLFSTYNGGTAPFVARLLDTGPVDAGFMTQLAAGPNGSVFDMGLASDGSIFLAGEFTSVAGGGPGRVAKLTTDGARDTNFAATSTGFNQRTGAIAIDPSSRLVVGGEYTAYGATSVRGLSRLSLAGELDASFANNFLAGFNLGLNAILTESDGHIVVVGSFSTFQGTTRQRILRFKDSGEEDTAFSGTVGTGFDNAAFAIAEAADGGYFVGGSFVNFNGKSVARLVRLSHAGDFYDSFTLNLGTGLNGDVHAVAVDPDGNVIVGGDFTTCDGTAAPHIARISAEGILDTAFLAKVGTGFDGTVKSLAIQSNGRILVGGSFNTYQGKAFKGLARIR